MVMKFIFLPFLFNKMTVSVHRKGHVAGWGTANPKGPTGWHLTEDSVTLNSAIIYTIDIYIDAKYS